MSVASDRNANERPRPVQRTGIGTWEWDLISGRAIWSEEMYRIHGIGPGGFSGTPDTYMSFVHPEDRAVVQEMLEHLLGGGEGRPLEYRIRRPDGEVRYILGTSEIVHHEGGRPVRVVGTVRDVSQLRQAERTQDSAATALRQSEERFRALIEHSYDVITVFDSDGTVLYTTPSSRRVLGREPAEMIGRPGYEIVHPDDLEEASLAFQEAVEQPGSITHVIHRVRHKDGSYRTVEVTGTNLLHDDAVRGIVSNLRDITERQQAAEAVRRSEAQYRALVDHAVVGIYRSTLDGRILSVNPALVEMLGFESAEAMLAVNMESLYEDPAERGRMIERYGRTGRPFSTEARWKRRDGRAITVRLSGRPVAPDEGFPGGFEVVVEDVSEQRELEASLRQAQKMEAVGRLAGGIAHDFNNLLTVILGEAEMTLAAGVEGPVAESLNRIKSSGERAARLTGQLLSFSRRGLVRPVVLDLNELVTEVGRMLRRLIEENVDLELDLQPDLWTLRADRSQLEQLLLNLAVNARDAMPGGGILRIETANASITADKAYQTPGLDPGEYARLVVRDSGVGMTEEVKAHAFEPFFTTKGERGTGLGLATCYSIVKQHRGYVEVDSEEGSGTTITLYLPRAGAQEAAAGSGSEASVPGGSETVLVVEDEDEVRDVTVRMLERVGYSVLAAADGEEALSVVEERGGDLDLLVTDVVLCGIGGRELAGMIASRCPGIRVVYVSGYTGDDNQLSGGAEQGPPPVQKPFTLEELAGRVREVLDARQASE